jgi:hypothetical protein
MSLSLRLFLAKFRSNSLFVKGLIENFVFKLFCEAIENVRGYIGW